MTVRFSSEIKKQLERLGVTAVYLFGSRAHGRVGPFSDFDFAVLLEDPSRIRIRKDSRSVYDAL